MQGALTCTGTFLGLIFDSCTPVDRIDGYPYVEGLDGYQYTAWGACTRMPTDHEYDYTYAGGINGY